MDDSGYAMWYEGELEIGSDDDGSDDNDDDEDEDELHVVVVIMIFTFFFSIGQHGVSPRNKIYGTALKLCDGPEQRRIKPSVILSYWRFVTL